VCATSSASELSGFRAAAAMMPAVQALDHLGPGRAAGVCAVDEHDARVCVSRGDHGMPAIGVGVTRTPPILCFPAAAGIGQLTATRRPASSGLLPALWSLDSGGVTAERGESSCWPPLEGPWLSRQSRGPARSGSCAGRPGLTQEELAAPADVSLRSVSDLERGRVTIPHHDTPA